MSAMATLVLVHGAGCDRHFFDELVRHLDGVETHALDLPGRGASPSAPAGSVAEAADFVAKGLAERGIERAVVLGHSFGGAVAIELALTSPARVAGLVLVSTGARLRVHPAILEAMRRAAEQGEPAVSHLPWLPEADRALVERVTAHLRAVPPASTFADWQAANAFDRMTELSRIAAPALVVAGTNDPLTPPKYAKYLAEHLPHARLALVEGAGHMLPVEHAIDLAREVSAFLTDVRA